MTAEFLQSLWNSQSDQVLVDTMIQWSTPLPESQMIHAVDDIDQLCDSPFDGRMRDYGDEIDFITAEMNSTFEG